MALVASYFRRSSRRLLARRAAREEAAAAAAAIQADLRDTAAAAAADTAQGWPGDAQQHLRVAGDEQRLLVGCCPGACP